MIEIKSNGKVDARKLHKMVVKDARGGQNGEMFAHWMQRMLEYGFEQGVDYSIIEYNYTGAKISKSDNQRVAKRDYDLSIDCAKEISMIQRNDKGKQLRKYFISIQTDRQELDTLTHDEVVNLSKRIEAFKYEDNQKPISKCKRFTC